MNNIDIVKEGYNVIANKYLASRKEDSEDVKLLRDLVRRLPKEARILDSGCGSGIPVTRFLSQRFEVIGVDFSEAQIQLAHQFAPQAQFICKDMTQLAFPDNYFHAICSYYAIIHIPRQEHKRLLRNFHRMLKPLGLVLLCMGAGDLESDLQEDYLGVKMYWSHYDADTNIEMLKECGFKIIWHKLVDDPLEPGSLHLFVMAQKQKNIK